MKQSMIGICLFLIITIPCPAQVGEGVDKVMPDETAPKMDKPKSKAMLAKEAQADFLKDWSLRLRVASLTPSLPVDIEWRWGGEGLGGDVHRGLLCEQLEIGAWSPSASFSTFSNTIQRQLILTVVAHENYNARGSARSQKAAAEFKDCAFEFEFSHQGKVLRQFTEKAPDGATASVIIFGERLAASQKPDESVAKEEICGILEYATRRAEKIEVVPWAKGPFPKKYMIATDLSGYGVGRGYGIRTCDRAVMETECRTLRLLGINTLRAAPEFLRDMIDQRVGLGAQFARRALNHTMGLGYPAPVVQRDDKTKEIRRAPEGAGCAFHPGIPGGIQTNLVNAAEILKRPLDEVWAITVDEIGNVFHGAPNGMGHFLDCPYCLDGFRQFAREKGRAPADFGKQEWSEVKPINFWGTDKQPPSPDPNGSWRTNKDDAFAVYQTALFINEASARLFTPQRDFFIKANAEKRKAHAAGDKDSPAAKRPYVYNYAMRGCTFLRQWGSLDFFDFYRHADNAFVYETSNRDPRIWHWDSYLNDVGRVVCAKQGLKFGILVKPHRGAPIQRMLSAVARNARMIFWYTYGPDYKKGDSFSADPDLLVKVSKGANLLGKAEDVLYDASWAQPPQVALVRTRQPPAENPDEAVAVSEDAKWIFTALTHAHVPVDPLDETTLEQEDFSHYKLIYAIGSTMTRAAAKKVAAWVKQGGSLYTSCHGLRFDEWNRPLEPMREVLGLQKRNPVELWQKVEVAGATTLKPLRPPPPDAPQPQRIAAGSLSTNSYDLAIGREVLEPASDAETLAFFSDGKPAVTRSAYGKGQVYVVGFFGGLEYAASTMKLGPDRQPDYDMTKNFDDGRRNFVAAPALSIVKPTVDAGQPTVEGVLMRNASTGKQAVVLINWTYRSHAFDRAEGRRPPNAYVHIAFENLVVTIRGAGDGKRAISAESGQALLLSNLEDGIKVTLPKLEEGDVLLLE
ncbi:MAG: beta-galactosidase trimerization domain-containing protein [Verrucomicrobia bacterium]|nr:beta-galactosidase trimerization domain-containing protein [Verrucomicrobiota bacterium]